ncbi:hypothetical protein KR054_008327, partial [Drosophila jambulina]
AETESLSPGSDQYEIQFPLPDIDPSMCRDEFIQKYVDAEERRISALKPRLTLGPRNMSIAEGPIKWAADEDTPDKTKLLGNIMRKWFEYVRSSMVQRKLSMRLSHGYEHRLTLLAELHQQCQKAAIEFMTVRLIRQLRLFSRPWPGNLDEVPYRLFSWSLDYFLSRLDHNQMYLDVMNRERTSEDLDCLKFRTDLQEIILLIYEIREDFCDDHDLCNNSIDLLRDARYNLDGEWIQGLADNRHIRDKLKAAIRLDTSSSVDIKNTRLTEVLDQIEDVSAMDPIELRYRINWHRSCADQRLMRLNGREEELEKQLRDLEDTIYQDELVQNHTENIYSLEVNGLREQLYEWQVRYENDLENAEVECTVGRLAVQKLKDDLKFYKEQEQIYKRRIAEERELIATEEKIRRDKQVG